MSLAATVRVLWCESVSSTQDELHAMAENGAPAGTAIAARYQTAGRGSRGRPWESDAGGLWMSTLVRPDAPAGLEPLVPRVAIQIAELLDSIGVPDLGLKWPNDVLARGRKLAGILSEARWNAAGPGWVAVGVGINVRNAYPAHSAWPATNLAELGIDRSPEALADEVARAIVRASAAPGPLSEHELGQWHRLDVLRGQRISSPRAGVVTGISGTGALLVEDASGKVTAVSSGTVTLATT